MSLLLLHPDVLRVVGRSDNIGIMAEFFSRQLAPQVSHRCIGYQADRCDFAR